ncbi:MULTISPECIES: 3-isopropylmalate dehydratase small subunit [Glycomyces]|uniref:3-isopropylmalate dehydratase small subunit n=1 Tax=Glycomyces artemisiae TaxID=1076443 RepID=A0A2T0UIY0_9ACTN|nr:3-isopropylmalate dehydratase small subunit [Glycomyces artemisiae]NUQ89986.1 3-isopropylmalate dehydratase small subunit [Glycomyces artemisiae]PRY57818.1 3-isopropylmalate/(R)-2-methylmalate dehydratase small subunit [Glycomyces artemisiae]
MDKFTTHTGRVAPLRRSNVDTDQIIPAVYLKRVTKTGFEDALFAEWREDEKFLLNQDEYKSATILVAGTEFGTGSSREHAVWALKDYGFKAVIAPRFGDIFRGNSLKNGLLTVELPEAAVEELWHLAEVNPDAEVTVDLEACEVRAGDRTWAFEFDEFLRWRMMEGLDDVALTLRDEDKIAAFESNRDAWRPRTLPAAA